MGQVFFLVKKLRQKPTSFKLKTEKMSEHPYIPEGFETVSPYFIVKDATGFIKFLEHAFDASLVFEHADEAKRLIHARIKIGTSLIEVSEAKENYPAKPFNCQLFVPDCDAVFRNALEAGAVSTGEPSDMPYGLRAGYIKDSWGNEWYISTQIEGKYNPGSWSEMENPND